MVEDICIVCLNKAEYTDCIKQNSFLYMYKYIKCPVCGNYIKEAGVDNTTEIFNIMDINYKYLRIATEKEENQRRALLKYYLRKETSIKNDFEITSEWIHNILQSKILPNPIEQIDNLLLYLGNNFSLGHPISIDNLTELNQERFKSVIGCLDNKNLEFVFKSSQNRGYTDIDNGYLTLSINGWERFNKINKGTISYNKAFLAMKFGSEFITDDLINKIKISLENIGYQLESLLDRQQAGLINDHLRQRIKNSKFVIVDLSDNNNGAYWEGGYAEGLDKPVIYICDKDQFKNTSHFDTNHHLTVMYDSKCIDENNEYHINNFLIKLQNVIKESV